MNRILCTILLLNLVSLLSAQQLEQIFQGSNTIVVDQQTCTSPTACNDMDPLTLDLCLSGRCAHVSQSGLIPNLHPQKMRLMDNGDLWYTTYGGLVQYDGSQAEYTSTTIGGWPDHWRMNNHIDPAVAPNGEVWIVGSMFPFLPNNTVGHWDGSQFTSYSNQGGGPLSAGEILDISLSSSGEFSVLHQGGMLSQFDGTAWTIVNLNQIASIVNFTAFSIEYDTANELWIGGLNNSQHTNLVHFDGSSWSQITGGSVVNNTPVKLKIDSNNNKWLYSHSSILNRYNGIWQTYTYANNNLTFGNISALAEGQNGAIWLAMGIGGLSRFDPASGTSVAYSYLNSANPINSVYTVAANPNSNVVYAGSSPWHATEVVSFDGNTFNLLARTRVPCYRSNDAFLSLENDGNIWYQVSISNEILYFDGSNWVGLPESISFVNDVLVDAFGVVWLTAPSNVGNYIFVYTGGTAYTQLTIPFAANSLGEMALDANDHIWVNYVDGVFEFDGNNWTDYSSGNGNFPVSSDIKHLAADANGRLWAWCELGEVLHYDGTSWSLIFNNPTTWSMGIVSGTQDEVYFVGEDALTRYENGVITTFDHNNSPWSSVRLGRVAVNPAGEFWTITTDDRLMHFDGLSYLSYDLDSLGFHADTASYLAFAPNGDMWVSNRTGVAQFSFQTAVDSVWPGDANDDLIANNFDILAIGQGFGSSGPARPNASLNWQAEAVPSWSTSLPTGVNHAHTDTDGSGIIDLDDTLAVNLNYGLTHNKNNGTAMSGATPLLIVPDFASYQAGDTVEAPIILGLDTLMADSVYGVAFTISYDPMLIDSGSLKVDYAQSWLGNKNQDMITLARDDYANAQVDLALSRTDQVERTGFGQIAKVRVVMIDDISGKTLIRDTLRLAISNVRLIRLDDTDIPYNTEPALVEITQEATAISTVSKDSWQIYPNPAQDQLVIKPKRSPQGQTQLKLYNSTGQLVYQKSLAIGEERIDLPALPNALYLLKLVNQAGIYQQKLQIVR